MTADFKTKKLPVDSELDSSKTNDDSYTVYAERYGNILELLQINDVNISGGGFSAPLYYLTLQTMLIGLHFPRLPKR